MRHANARRGKRQDHLPHPLRELNYRDPVSEDLEYTRRLQRLQQARWKQVLDVQRPYRWNLERLCSGRVLEIGCGIGRNLKNLRRMPTPPVGIDTNPESILVAREQGFEAYTLDEFFSGSASTPDSFDTLLLSHVLEHVTFEECEQLLAAYLPLLAPGGRVVIECPQEAGFPLDPTHIRWVDFDEARRQCEQEGLVVARQYSYPFPRWAGRLFVYNQFETLAFKPSASNG